MNRPTSRLCPCGSGKEYATCCAPYHQGAPALHPESLVRARYSAYAMNVPDYIIRTTHPASTGYLEDRFAWRRKISKFSQGTEFQKLQILEVQERLPLAAVTFTAFLAQAGKDATFTEKSHFQIRKGEWLYRGGNLVEGHTPNAVTVGQLRLLPLAYYGEEVLRAKALPVGEIDDALRQLVEEMIETMEVCDGIGLAAPQVHHSIRLFIVRSPREISDGEYEFGAIKVMINPVLSEWSVEQESSSEGCLSLPTVRGGVQRPVSVTVEYTDLSGERVRERVTGLEARIVMHEYDHIEGILFIDRLKKQDQERLKPVLKRLQRRLHDSDSPKEFQF